MKRHRETNPECGTAHCFVQIVSGRGKGGKTGLDEKKLKGYNLWRRKWQPTPVFFFFFFEGFQDLFKHILGPVRTIADLFLSW